MTNSPDTKARRKKSLSWWAMNLLFVNACLAFLVVLALARFGSITQGIAYVSGARLLADRPSRSFGRVAKDSNPELNFVVQNRSDHAISVLGAKVTCVCFVVDSLPVKIPAGVRRTVRVRVFTAGKTGEISGQVRLICDDPAERPITLSVRGTVLDGRHG